METSGEDFSGDWGERHDEELNASGQSQQTSGDETPLPEAARSIPTCRWTPRGTLSSEWESDDKSLSQKQKIVQ